MPRERAHHDPHEADPFAALRRQMVDEQLRRRDITDERVLAAMLEMPRERFVGDAAQEFAYTDRALPIDCEQTISQPFMVALMTQALQLQGDELVLEIGTGSGYQAAILSKLARRVISIERHPSLAATARQRFADLGIDNVEVRVGDGTLGCADEAPLDRILVTAGGPRIPEALFAQLAEGGLLVMPVGPQDRQELYQVEKRSGRACVHKLSGCRFVQLIGEQGWSER